MKELMSKSLCNERGAATIFFLIIAPLVIYLLLGAVSITTAISNTDVDIQEDIAASTRAAATCVDARSQAAGNPMIDAHLAHTVFRSSLASNLGLDPTDLQPLHNSRYAAAPKYQLLIYNGANNYGLSSSILFTFDGSVVTTSTGIGGTGFPKTYSISENSITLGNGGKYTVSLPTPGTISVLSIEAKPILGNINATSHRWASARIVWQ